MDDGRAPARARSARCLGPAPSARRGDSRDARRLRARGRRLARGADASAKRRRRRPRRRRGMDEPGHRVPAPRTDGRRDRRVSPRAGAGRPLARRARESRATPSQQTRHLDAAVDGAGNGAAGDPRRRTRSTTISAISTRTRAASTTRSHPTRRRARCARTSGRRSRICSRSPSFRRATRRRRSSRCTARLPRISSGRGSARTCRRRTRPTPSAGCASATSRPTAIRRCRRSSSRCCAAHDRTHFDVFAYFNNPQPPETLDRLGARDRARDARREGRGRRAMDSRRPHRHPHRHRRTHRAQPPRRVRREARAGADHVARLPQHHGSRRHRLSADRRCRRSSRRQRCAAQRNADPAPPHAMVLESAVAADGAMRRRPCSRRAIRRSARSTMPRSSPMRRSGCGPRPRWRLPQARLVIAGLPEGCAQARVTDAFARAGAADRVATDRATAADAFRRLIGDGRHRARSAAVLRARRRRSSRCGRAFRWSRCPAQTSASRSTASS